MGGAAGWGKGPPPGMGGRQWAVGRRDARRRWRHLPSPGRRRGEGARRAGEGRSAGAEATGEESAVSAPLRGAALIPLPGPSPTVGGRRELSRPLAPPVASTTSGLLPANTPTPARSPAGVLPVSPSDGGDGAPKGAIRMVAADDRPPQGVLRRPRLSAPRGNGVAWVPVLPLAVCGPARFPRLSRRRRYSLAASLRMRLPPPSRKPGTPLVVAAGGFTHDPPRKASASSPAAGHRRPPRGHRYAPGCAPPSGRGEVWRGMASVSRELFLSDGRVGCFSAVGSRQSAVGSRQSIGSGQ